MKNLIITAACCFFSSGLAVNAEASGCSLHLEGLFECSSNTTPRKIHYKIERDDSQGGRFITYRFYSGLVKPSLNFEVTTDGLSRSTTPDLENRHNFSSICNRDGNLVVVKVSTILFPQYSTYPETETKWYEMSNVNKLDIYSLHENFRERKRRRAYSCRRVELSH